MASPVDSARQGTNISTAATSHAINVGSPVAGTLLIVMVRFAAAPGTVTFTGYTQFAADTSDASDDDTRLYYRWADGSEGATDTLATTNSVKLAAISWEVTGAENPATTAPTVSTVVIGTAANVDSARPLPSPSVSQLLENSGAIMTDTNPQAQSFLSSGSTVSIARLWFTNASTSPTQNINVSIQADSGGAPSGTPIGTTATMAASSLTSTSTPYDFVVDASVSTSTTYWIVVARTGTPTGQVSWRGHSISQYADGAALRYNGSAWVAATLADFRFEVYSLTTNDYLFLTVIGMDHETATATQPTGYSNLASANSGTGGAVATNCMIWGASKGATSVTSDDPGAWTSTAPTTGVTAFTIAIPAPAAAAPGASIYARRPRKPHRFLTLR